jgi:hypothetical protein
VACPWGLGSSSHNYVLPLLTIFGVLATIIPINSQKMENEFLNNALLTYSPPQDETPLPSSPPQDETPLPSSPPTNGSVRESVLSVICDGDLDGASEDEDGLNVGRALLDFASDYGDDGFSDEQVAVASEQYSWKINHAKGDHKLKGTFECNLYG